jgi:hypothetical protein
MVSVPSAPIPICNPAGALPGRSTAESKDLHFESDLFLSPGENATLNPPVSISQKVGEVTASLTRRTGDRRENPGGLREMQLSDSFNQAGLDRYGCWRA